MSSARKLGGLSACLRTDCQGGEDGAPSPWLAEVWVQLLLGVGKSSCARVSDSRSPGTVFTEWLPSVCANLAEGPRQGGRRVDDRRQLHALRFLCDLDTRRRNECLCAWASQRTCPSGGALVVSPPETCAHPRKQIRKYLSRRSLISRCQARLGRPCSRRSRASVSCSSNCPSFVCLGAHE